MNVRLTAAALAELADAFDWYEARQPGLGHRFLDEIEEGRRRIEEFPAEWHPIGRGVRRFRLNSFPYGLVYVIEADEIVVVSAMHLLRRPSRWKASLDAYRKGKG